MPKRILTTTRTVIPLVLLVSLVWSCRSKSKKENSITIATAASMQFAMSELTKKFSSATGVECELVISSSGKLTAQIMEGAPFDLLVSADLKYPEMLYANGLSKTKPKVYAYGKLVLWTANNEMRPSLELLSDEKIQHIALANPKTAPYGKAAIEVLQHYGLYDTLKPKLVFGESIAQVNQFILSEAAEVGFTAKSVVLSSEMKTKGNWTEIGATAYTPVAQGVIALKSSPEKNAAIMEFYNFIFSNEAKKVLENFGYSVNE